MNRSRERLRRMPIVFKKFGLDELQIVFHCFLEDEDFLRLEWDGDAGLFFFDEFGPMRPTSHPGGLKLLNWLKDNEVPAFAYNKIKADEEK